MKGLIHSIQSYNIHDGPGLRTIVFFQGCPLHCLWCSNPDTQPNTPYFIKRTEICIECGQCVDVDAGTNVCPTGARIQVGEVVEAEYVIEHVMHSRSFFRDGRGGLTLSGGEPLAQSAFACELLSLASDALIHTTVETSGYSPWEAVHDIAVKADLLLFDIKHIDPETHRKLTGQDNTQILSNLRRISEITNTIVRIPIIGGINDDDKAIEQTVAFLLTTAVRDIHLLPYHEYGLSKYALMNRDYICHGRTPDRIVLERIACSFRKTGFNVRIFSH
jgi:pyruvate formate lyase activating enzyme